MKKYKDFLLEWGYGGEGGVMSKDQIKVKNNMITNIDLELEEDDDDESELSILKDFEKMD